MRTLKVITGVLVLSMLVFGVSIAQVKALSPPSWVPTTVAGWTLAYSAPFTSPYELAVGNNSIVSNWTQIWFSNTSDILSGIIGVVTFQYSSDFFDQQLSSTLKNLIQLYVPGASNVNTIWDFFEFIMNASFSSDGFMDQTANITGASGAFSFNMTDESSSFYLLYAYAGPKAMMIFSMDLDPTILSWFDSNDTTDLGNYLMGNSTSEEPCAYWIAFEFASILTIFADIGLQSSSVSAPVAAVAALPHAADLTSATSESVVNSFASSYVSQVAGTNGIDGYPVLFVALAGMLAVFVIVRKRKIAVV